MKDYYNILGIQPNASEDEIRSAYKKLAMRHHPDRGGDQAAFQDVQEAYSTLTDAQKRQQWEHQRAFAQGGGNQFGFSFNFGPDINDIFGGHPFFGQGFRQQQRNRDVRVTIDLDLASTLTDQTRHIDIRTNDGNKKTIQVNIPKGVHDNLQMRFPGHGDNSIQNIQPGDLYVNFRIHVPNGYRVDSLNVIKKVSINSIDALLGCQRDIEYIDSKIFNLSVPPGTQYGTIFRIPQQGLFDMNYHHRGDLLIEIILETPMSITQDQFDKLKNLIK